MVKILKYCSILLFVASVASCVERRATVEECRLILDQIIDIELTEMGFRDPVVANQAKQRLAGKYAAELNDCIGRDLSQDAMRCVREARSTEELSHECLR